MDKDITRRSFIKTSLAGGAVALAAAHGLHRSPVWAADSKDIVRGGVFRMAESYTPNTLDVHKASMRFAVSGAIYDFLIDARVTPETQKCTLIPALATKWSEENDSKRLVFELRKGVKFHDGSPFDAKVAQWNLERLRNHPESHLKSELKVIAGVDVVDDYRIALNLSYPSKQLLYNLSSAVVTAGMVSKQFHDRHGEEEIYRKGAGSGPFRVKEWLVDNKVILERVEGYWKQGADGKPLPYLDGAELNYRPDKSQTVIDLRAGAMDAMEEPPPRDVEKIIKEGDTIYIPLPPAERSWPCLALNPRRKPFENTYLRKAAFYALDRERIAKIMGYGVGRAHQYPYITGGQSGWDPAAWADYSYNPELAQRLVKKDFPKGVDAELFYIEREPDRTIAQMVKSMWDKAGIRTKMGGRERLGWIETMRGDTYEGAFWSAPTRVGSAISVYVQSGGKSNWGNYQNPAVDMLLNAYDRTTDPKKSHDLMRSALGIIWMDAELTTGYAVPYGAAARKNVHGLQAHWDCLAIENVWKSKI